MASRNSERIDPLATPNWIGETKAKVVGASGERWQGKLEVTDDEIVIRLDKSLLDNPLWQSFIMNLPMLAQKFMGTRLTIKAEAKKGDLGDGEA